MDDKTTISFRIGTQEKDALDKIAASMQRDRSFVLNEAVTEFLDRQKAFTASIKRGLAEAKAGEFATDEEVEAAFAEWER
jgi:predicted transcriptional regulator